MTRHRPARSAMLPGLTATSIRGSEPAGSGDVEVTQNTDTPQPAKTSIADVTVGVVFGLLAGSNLVQGAWLADYPWLNLTTVAFALAVPISLAGLRRRTTITGALMVLLLFFALALGYLAPALNSNSTQKRISIAVAVAFVLVASYLSLTNPRRLKWLFITLTGLAVPVMIGQVFLADPLALATGRRTPLGLNAIGAGRALGAALVLVLTVLLAPGHRRLRLPLGLLALALGVSLYLDGSRGPVLGALIAVIVLLGKQQSLRRGHRIVLFAGAGLITVFAYQRSTIAGSRLADATTSGRDELYRQAALIAIDHPLGIGWGNFSRFAPEGLLGTDQSGNLYAHNIFLEFWIETGVLGALAFSIFSLVTLVSAFRAAALSLSGLALVALLVDLLTGAMLSSDVIGNRMMWVVLGAALASGAGKASALVGRSATPDYVIKGARARRER